MNWQEEFESLVRSIGSITYGKERWFYQDDGLWYDREDGKRITTDELHRRIYEEVKWLDDGAGEADKASDIIRKWERYCDCGAKMVATATGGWYCPACHKTMKSILVKRVGR